jgi:hypothetical protein
MRPAQKGHQIMDNGQTFSGVDQREEVRRLLSSLKAAGPRLKQLLEESGRCHQDAVYRFYHQSFKVYHLQRMTLDIVEALVALAPERPLNADFRCIIEAGTAQVFHSDVNDHWLSETRPIIEAFFHARYFLEMAIHYGQALDEPPNALPSGWAALLYLFNLR